MGNPDSVQVLTTQEDGSVGVYRLSGVVLPRRRACRSRFTAREGTLVYDLTRDEIRGAKRDDAGLEPLPIPDEPPRRLARRGRLHRGRSAASAP